MYVHKQMSRRLCIDYIVWDVLRYRGYHNVIVMNGIFLVFSCIYFEHANNRDFNLSQPGGT